MKVTNTPPFAVMVLDSNISILLLERTSKSFDEWLQCWIRVYYQSDLKGKPLNDKTKHEIEDAVHNKLCEGLMKAEYFYSPTNMVWDMCPASTQEEL